MNYLDQNGLKHLIEKIRAEIKAQGGQASGTGTKTPLNIAWDQVRAIVQAGQAAETFSIGDTFVSNHSDYGEILWDVIGFNRDTAVNGSPYTMTLQTHNVLPRYVFDQREGFYYAESGLTAGSWFGSLPYGKHPNRFANSTFQINLNEEIPYNSVFVMDWKDDQPLSDAVIYVYKEGTSTPIQTIPILGNTSNGYELYISSYPDCGLGNNSWKKSCMYQYLNEQNRISNSQLDLPYKDVFRGFSKGFDADFLSALGKFRVAEHNVETGSTVWTEELFSLPSLGNVNAGQSCSEDTVVYDAFSGETDEIAAQKRIKTRNGDFAPYLLRSPVQDTYNRVYYVASNGTISSAYACTEMGFSPICCVM